MTCRYRLQRDPLNFYSEFDRREEPWTTDFAGNWQGEVSGKNFDRYVVWVQQSLNRVLELRLAEDGDFGTKTRNALWTFRRQARLKSSGDVICPDTDQALIAAGATPPPGMVQARASETTPPALTVYVDIPLQIRLGNAKSMTGIFVPDGFCPVPQVDVIVFLHGFKVRVHKPEFSIAEYWKLTEFLLREEVNKSQKNVILVAPTLGPQNQPGSLTCPGGFDNFLGQVMLALKQHGPYAGQQTSPSIGNIILACHSGSGWVMRAIALGTDISAKKIQECWAFEPANMGVAGGWKQWARSRSQNKLYIYYLPGTSGQRLCAALMGRSVPKPGQVSCALNIFAEQSSAKHDLVPRTHLKDRIQGASFLAAKSSCAGKQSRAMTSPRRSQSPVGEMPVDLFSKFHQPMEFWNGAGSGDIWNEGLGAALDTNEVIANRIAYPSLEVWRDRVRSRKPSFVDGTGKKTPNENGPQHIRRLQRVLNRALGPQLRLDGAMGFRTRRAVRNFQRQKGLPVDGIVRLATERTLFGDMNDENEFEAGKFTNLLDQEVVQGQPQSNIQALYQDTLARIRSQLERPFQSPDDPKLLERRAELRRLFDLVPAAFAKELFIQLQNRADPLGNLLASKLAPATRTELLARLQNKFTSVSTPGVGLVSYRDIRRMIRDQLERQFSSSNDPKLLERRAELRRLFDLVPFAFAQRLYDRLQTQTDPLGSLLRNRLAPATRTELLGRLKNKQPDLYSVVVELLVSGKPLPPALEPEFQKAANRFFWFLRANLNNGKIDSVRAAGFVCLLSMIKSGAQDQVIILGERCSMDSLMINPTRMCPQPFSPMDDSMLRHRDINSKFTSMSDTQILSSFTSHLKPILLNIHLTNPTDDNVAFLFNSLAAIQKPIEFTIERVIDWFDKTPQDRRNDYHPVLFRIRDRIRGRQNDPQSVYSCFLKKVPPP